MNNPLICEMPAAMKSALVPTPFPAAAGLGNFPTPIVSLFQKRVPAGEVPERIALIGTYGPRKCGIATFTCDTREQLATFQPGIGIDVYALDEPDSSLSYDGVAGVIRSTDPADYQRAAQAINASGADVAWLQHEYGIFGGPDGEMVCDFVDRIAAPLVVTFHTVLSEPNPNQRRIMEHLITRCSRIMVMSDHGRDLLVERYGASRAVIDVISHGAPDRPFGRSDTFKAQLGLEGRKVLMTFGLLGPGKGIERVIEALPGIVARHPDTVYRIVGATHPGLVAREGERYRESLQALARDLGVEDHVIWENRFLETADLLDQIEACDIYVTPYFNLQQSTSGTLSYAVALGKAVVSTPYVHARELLADGVGVLVEPNSSSAIEAAINALLDDPEEHAATCRRAYARGRLTIWPEYARATADLLSRARAPAAKATPITALPGLSAVFAMSDSTGMLQHAVGIVPNRRHGYCVDDNVRALMLMNVAQGLPLAERMRWSLVYAAFIQDAWNPDTRRFRNFMRFDRGWCEDAGSDDSNGRTLWTLGHTVENAPDPDLRHWAFELYRETVEPLAAMDSPRAMAFCMLGACAVLRTLGEHEPSRALLLRAGPVLHSLLEASRRPDWAWFEAVLGYDNPRLPQALIEAGVVLGQPHWTTAGLETLEWINSVQLSAAGLFRPVGSESFGKVHDWMPFDQQPLEAQATVEAARAALAATGHERWIDAADAAYRWFFGANDRGAVLADLATGRCRDGVTPRGANLNCGAESILAFQLAYYGILAIYERTTSSHSAGIALGSRDIGPASVGTGARTSA